jgi:hypothetical protein
MIKKKSRGSTATRSGFHLQAGGTKSHGMLCKRARGRDLRQLEIEETMQYGCTHITDNILFE